VPEEAGLLLAVADELIPFFRNRTVDRSLAHRMAIRAVQAYQPETRADCVNAGRTIAFSMAALALLGNAASEDMEMPEKLRILGRANALNRSADQSERSMMQRRRYLRAKAAGELPHPLSMPSEPSPDFSEARIKAAMAEAISEYRAARAQGPAEAPTPQTNPDPIARPTAAPRPSPAADHRQPPATTPQNAIHHGTAKPRPASYRQRLMQHSTMAQADFSHPLMNMPPSIEVPGAPTFRNNF
jgi:hypothetical protein